MWKLLFLVLGLTACVDSGTKAPEPESADAGTDTSHDANTDDDSPRIQNLRSKVVAPLNEASVFSVTATHPDPMEVLTYSVWSTTCPFDVAMDSELGFLNWMCPAQDLSCAVEIEVQDEQGLSDRGSLVIQCLRGAPFFTGTPSAQATEQQEYTYGAVCKDVDGAAAQIVKGSGDTCGGRMSGNTYVWTPNEMQGGGKCLLELICTNEVASSTQAQWVSVMETNQPPRFRDLPLVRSTPWGRSDGFTLHADDPDYPATTLTMKLLSTTCDFPLTLLNGRVVSYTCGTTLGTCVSQFEVSDGEDYGLGSLTIACTNSAPEIRAAQVVPIQATGEPLTCAYDYYDADQDEDHSSVEWLIDGVVVGWQQRFISYAEGDVVTCRVTPADPISEGTPFESVPVVVPPRLIVAVGEAHVCVRTKTGGVRCWGDNTFGRVGGSGVGVIGPTTPQGLGSDVSSVVVGSTVSCAIQTGELKCWGDGSRGLLGPDIAGSSMPVVVMAGVEAVAVGAHHACAIQNGGLFCWGENTFGQLGVVSAGTDTPTLVPGLESGVTGVAVGESHSCAIQNGALKCFGDNGLGQLGRSTATSSDGTPEIVDGFPYGTERVVAGDIHTCAVKGTQLRCWGWGTSGALGFPATGAVRSASVAFYGSRLEAAGGQNTCVVSAGVAECWGLGNSEQLLGGSGPTHVQVLGPMTTAIGVGKTMICGERDAGLYCWGDGSAVPVLINY